MSRLPFDASLIPEPDEPDPPARRERKQMKSMADAKHLSVSELANLIKSTLEQRITSPIQVVGQVSNLSVRNHWYFSLKDESAVVQCVAWASSAKNFSFTPNDGDEILARGHISHYPPQGRTQLYVSQIKPIGAGVLQQRFEAMCRELRELGYFADDHKIPLPVFPKKIAVITSVGGAALQDIISTGQQRCPAVGLVLIDVKVQGDDAAEEVARTIHWVDANHQRLGVDAVLVTRGGGSVEDLWAFNERIVADAAYACQLPLVAAIGHESDTTVIELVADLRAATPTQAAMSLIPSAVELSKQVDHLAHRLHFVTKRTVEHSRQRISQRHRQLQSTLKHIVAQANHRLAIAMTRWAQLQPQTLLTESRERLAVLSDRLWRAMWRRTDQRPQLRIWQDQLQSVCNRKIENARQRITSLERELHAIDPHQVFARGYSLTATPDGRVVRSIGDVKTGQRMVTHVQDGTIDSRVEQGKAHRPRSRQKGTDRSDQLDLFPQQE